ncbi:methyltransferase family protein [Leptothrix discophora]|uniref:Isoprenylcysteine carboxylmethyltransferase family protein n=1 Tax=Leptothrix discophora TaxID=89 RepID=A0ABT9FYS6_LEPDI|nr:isoprenylcysteine carboxylmethyltransferase family protein [Leptothrix discophora]MDP4299390.1 isoprenylcysteine carboxylmethyltransferase family protein [Leptothrix discophora]
MSFLDHRIPPPAIGALVAWGMWGLAGQGPSLGLAPAWQSGLVATLVLSGLAFDVAGLLAFRASRTTINPMRPQRSTALVTGGVYRLTRNPMYVGMALLLTAWALHLGAWLALAGPVVFVLYITRFQIQPEERVLAGLFGDAFMRYAAQVRRWL